MVGWSQFGGVVAVWWGGRSMVGWSSSTGHLSTIGPSTTKARNQAKYFRNQLKRMNPRICLTGIIRKRLGSDIYQSSTHQLVDLDGQLLATLTPLENYIRLDEYQDQLAEVCGISRLIENVQTLLVDHISCHKPCDKCRRRYKKYKQETMTYEDCRASEPCPVYEHPVFPPPPPAPALPIRQAPPPQPLPVYPPPPGNPNLWTPRYDRCENDCKCKSKKHRKH